jgi:RNA polymerase sigma-70 factor (ECF subfamily)
VLIHYAGVFQAWRGRLDTDEICKEWAITPANGRVLLYRARLRLRECLDLNWFGNASSTI